MGNVADFKVTNEDAKYLCDFMGIDAIRHSDTSYSWSDGVRYSTHEDDYYKCMSNIWRYVGTRKVYDWNWLMSVVKKISGLDTSGFKGDGIILYGILEEMSMFECSNNMGYVYECCVSFVKWYNANVK